MKKLTLWSLLFISPTAFAEAICGYINAANGRYFLQYKDQTYWELIPADSLTSKPKAVLDQADKDFSGVCVNYFDKVKGDDGAWQLWVDEAYVKILDWGPTP